MGMGMTMEIDSRVTRSEGKERGLTRRLVAEPESPTLLAGVLVDPVPPRLTADAELPWVAISMYVCRCMVDCLID